MNRFVIPPVFKPLWQPMRYKGAHGGRGSGKSYNFAAMAVVQSANQPGVRGACIREVQKTLADSAQRLIGDTIDRLGLGDRFDKQTSMTRCPGGGTISYIGMQDHTAESFKSYENLGWVWIEEAHTLSARSLEILRPTVRAKGSEIWASWNPRSAADPIDTLLRGMDTPPNAAVIEANYMDNEFFTEELEAERAHDEKFNRDRYAHIWLGAYEPQAKGAIWQRQGFHQNRVRAMPCERGRTLVGVDPAVSDTDTSNEHGITVGCLGADDRGYMLEDASLHGSPHQWATRAVAMFDKWDADAVVIEINQGGDMCRHTLETIRKGLPIIEVRATRGKHVRAEPISSLYQLDRISHVGTFTEMEDQFCLFTAHGWEGDDDKSPDRAESAIWLWTELFPDLTSEATKRRGDDDYRQYGANQTGSWMT